MLRLKEILDDPESTKSLNLRDINKGKILAETKKVDAVLDHITTTNIADIRNVICAAVIVGDRLGVQEKERKEKQDLWWKRRIKCDIKILRKDLSRIEAWNKGKLRKERESLILSGKTAYMKRVLI